jgi:hypothetical protein
MTGRIKDGSDGDVATDSYHRYKVYKIVDEGMKNKNCKDFNVLIMSYILSFSTACRSRG